MSSLAAVTGPPAHGPHPGSLPVARSWPGLSPPANLFLGCKTAFDWLLALLLLLLSAPVVLLALLVVKLTSRGPALYTQTRVGRKGRPFTIFKIRTMTYRCEDLTGPRWSTNGDSRVTQVGKFLRATHIDELPQLFNILRGDMSLVGPRPERPEFVPQLEQAIPLYRARLLVKPGLTGLAQVQLPPDSNLASVRLKLAYDLYYVRHVDFWLDLRLLLATATKILGLPFRGIRCLFGFATCEEIEKGYLKQVEGQMPPSASPADPQPRA